MEDMSSNPMPNREMGDAVMLTKIQKRMPLRTFVRRLLVFVFLKQRGFLSLPK